MFQFIFIYGNFESNQTPSIQKLKSLTKVTGAQSMLQTTGGKPVHNQYVTDYRGQNLLFINIHS